MTKLSVSRTTSEVVGGTDNVMTKLSVPQTTSGSVRSVQLDGTIDASKMHQMQDPKSGVGTVSEIRHPVLV